MATADFSPSLPSGTALENRLSRLARRRNAQKMSRAIVRAAIWGVALAALAVLGWKLHIIPDGPMWAPFAIIGVFVLWGVRNGWLQRAGTFAAACDADNALAWDDRLSSALAFVSPDQVKRQTKIAPQNGALARFKAALLPRFATSTAPAVPPTDLVPALVDEASARAQNLDPRRVYPLPFDRRAQILTALSLLFVGFCFMPEFPLFQTIQERRQVAAMQNAGEKLVAVAKNVRKTENPKAAEVNRLSRRLEKLGQKMVRGRMTKRAALTEIGELRQQLQKAQQKNSKAQSSAALPQIAEALRETPLQSQTGRKVQEQLAQNKWDEAAKELEKLADKVQNNQLSQSEKQKAAEDLKKTAQDLRSRGGEANKQAAQQLEQAAKQLQQPQNEQKQDQAQQQGEKQQQNGQQQGQDGQKQNQGEQKQGANQPQQGQNPQGQNQEQQSGNQQQQQQGGQNSPQNGGNQQQQQKQGDQGSQQGAGGQSQQQQGGQEGDQAAADALRNMANGLRQGGSGGSNSQGLQDMMSKLRAAENQTGSNGGQQFGNAKPTEVGSGNCPGGDCRGTMTPGKDLKASDPHGMVGGGAGLGPRNNAQGVNSGGGVSKTKSLRTGDKRRYQDVWSDRLPKTRQKIDRVKGKWGGSGEMEQLPTKGEAKGGQARTPYYDVYESYKRDAEDAVSRESVPPAYKQPVKDYFESIKP